MDFVSCLFVKSMINFFNENTSLVLNYVNDMSYAIWQSKHTKVSNNVARRVISYTISTR